MRPYETVADALSPVAGRSWMCGLTSYMFRRVVSARVTREGSNKSSYMRYGSSSREEGRCCWLIARVVWPTGPNRAI